MSESHEDILANFQVNYNFVVLMLHSNMNHLIFLRLCCRAMTDKFSFSLFVTKRNVVFVFLQSITGIDLPEAILHLEETNWDLLVSTLMISDFFFFCFEIIAFVTYAALKRNTIA